MVIITADDFGLHTSVNEAVELACREGILNTASLIMGAAATADAVRRARCLPKLRVGLHLVLADGRAVLAPAEIPALVGSDGRFGRPMAVDGVRFFFLPWVRRQLAREIRAQFDAFQATGLTLDHVNTHKHFHLHPTVLSLILEIGRDYGLRAMRLPYPAKAPLWLRPWMALLRGRLDRAGVAHNDYVVGIAQSGRFDEAALVRTLENLPPGVGEIYLHPARLSGAVISASMKDYRHADELAALVSPKVRAILSERAIRLGSFADLVGAA